MEQTQDACQEQDTALKQEISREQDFSQKQDISREQDSVKKQDAAKKKAADTLEYYIMLTYGILPYFLLGSVLELIGEFIDISNVTVSALLFLIVPILLYAAAIAGLSKFSKKGLLSLSIIFVFWTASLIWNTVQSPAAEPEDLIASIISLAFYAVWGTLTYFYFRKRKEKFGIIQKEEKKEDDRQ